MNNERRYRYFCIETDQIMCLLGNWKGSEFVKLPLVKGLPEGYQVAGVEFSFAHDAFILKVYHESFPVQGAGMYPQLERFDLEWVCIQPHESVISAKKLTAAEAKELSEKWNRAMFDEARTVYAMRPVNLNEIPADIGAKPAPKSWEFLGAP